MTFTIEGFYVYALSTRCTNCTQIEPSPTAEATRLTLPERTSPTANTPGRLVSRRYGARGSGQCAAARSCGAQVGAGAHEALVVERHAALAASGVGHGAGHEEDVADRRASRRSPAPCAPDDALEVVVALQRHDLGARVQRDVRVLLDAPDEVARHALGEARAERTSMCTWRQLPARNTAAWPAELPPPTIDDFLAVAELRLEVRGGVVDAQRRRSAAGLGAFGLAVLRAGGDDDRSRQRPCARRPARSRKAGARSRGAPPARRR